jgi:hypothetical protein
VSRARKRVDAFQPSITYGRDKRLGDRERRVDRGSFEITYSQKSDKSCKRVLVTWQFLDRPEINEQEPFFVSPDLRNPYVAPATTGAPHQMIAAEVDTEESAHDASTISRLTGWGQSSR